MRKLTLIGVLVLAGLAVAQGPRIDKIGVQDIGYGGTWTRTYISGLTAEMYGVTPINVIEFGAIPDDSGDDYSVIQAAIDSCEAWGGGAVYIPPGTFNCSATLSVEGDNIGIIGVPGSIIQADHDSIGLRIGAYDAQHRSCRVRDLRLTRASFDSTDMNSIGIKVVNHYNGIFDGHATTYFKYGMYVTSAGGYGSALNTFIPDRHQDDQYPLWVEPADTNSWCNSNTWVGGWFKSYGPGRPITINWPVDTIKHPNMNTMYAPTCEGRIETYTAVIGGELNTIYNMRNEPQSGDPDNILFQQYSERCGVIGGWGIWPTQFEDLGEGNRIDMILTGGGYYIYPDSTEPGTGWDSTNLRGTLWFDAEA